MARMQKLVSFLKAWGPALVIMTIIFISSSRPESLLPDFHWADKLVYKTGHILGYGLLALSYWKGLEMRPGRQAVALTLAVAYGFTDELHQSFVPGRTASWMDLFVYDGLGALLSLLIFTYYSRAATSRATGRE
jgi:VanZ family protein